VNGCFWLEVNESRNVHYERMQCSIQQVDLELNLMGASMQQTLWSFLKWCCWWFAKVVGEKVGDKESEIGADEATWIRKLLAASQN